MLILVENTANANNIWMEYLWKFTTIHTHFLVTFVLGIFYLCHLQQKSKSHLNIAHK